MTHPTLPATEHHHVGGSAGGPGENSAECACGVTYAGFDTHREAVELLNRHVEQENGREKKRADQLAVGDIAVDILGSFDPWVSHRDGKVLASYPYVDEVDNSRVLLVVESDGPKPKPETVRLDAEVMVGLRSEAELAAKRELAERAQRIADMRRLIDWVEQHPELPLYSFSASEHLHAPDDGTDEANVARVRAVAALMGVKTYEHLDDRTKVTVNFGHSSYDLIAWHKDGRPAEPSRVVFIRQDGTAVDVTPEPGEVDAPAEDQGFGYSREQDDPTPVSPARGGPVHTGGVVAGGQLVDETPAVPAGCDGDPCTLLHHHPAEDSFAPNAFTKDAPDPEFPEGEPIDDAESPVPVLTPAGLTVEADLSRGPLAGTTPVVAYFTVGRDYVTVAAPTYDNCREAMFAKYGDRWGLSYLAGTQRATDAVRGKLEREVIVAADTDPASAEVALKAAAELLADEPVSESR